MNEKDLIEKLHALQQLQVENEIVEFKEAKTSFDFEKLGQYFSALSNEANLKNVACGWLVFGIENKHHTIVGTKYKANKPELESLKKLIADKVSNRISFIEIHELILPEGRVLLFQIPPAPAGIPVSFEGHYYGRDHESLVALNIEEQERIRAQSNHDWSAVIVQDATHYDLDQMAIQKARVEYAKRNPRFAQEVSTWDDSKFLDKAKITIQGKITRTALILLGKEESEHFLGSFVKIRWNLKSINNEDKASEVYSIPLILAIDEVYRNIRNLKYIYFKDGTLFPDEVLRYDPFSIREPLNNAIAHQDYSKHGYINVVEFEDDHLVFSNVGKFLPKSVEHVVLMDTPEESYRNPFLVAAMKNLDMVETQGGGIRKIFNHQRARYFPMPEYDLNYEKVKVTISGKVLNEDFARILINNRSLSLEDILLLDRVQKQKPITDEEFKNLKKNKFIEGRKGNTYLSFKVIQPINNDGLKAEYLANKSFDDAYFRNMILEYLAKFGKTNRSAIDNLIIPKLSAILNDKQKKYKVGNLLSSLRRQGLIQTTNYGVWELVSSNLKSL